ncbi:hypothetical protein [Solitalea koreensis]|uniref:Uncharacterized protein n=1 Tax=Solitalea koreensis TaxID=543615 RepID=A0A521AL23_9SPHI|nr:hypothetical protein [Solitalea koreensis]SMO35554.1 hypothetical protein SAMN06265350_101213 [Solitalea koreensis]
MDAVFSTAIAFLSLCVTVALFYYVIKYLKTQTELTQLKMEKLKKEIEQLEDRQ